jgi:hypothetical protein
VLHCAVGVDDDGHGHADIQCLVETGLVLVHEPLLVLDPFAMPLIA